MVIVGNFSARLVDATSKEPLPEHVRSGEVFAEVESDTEYYIEIQVIGSAIRPKKKICFQFSVDGTKLESRTIINKKTGPGVVGLLSRKHGVVTNKAFRFQKASNRRSNRDSYTVGPDMVFGSVIVQISDAVPVRTLAQDDFQEEFGAVQPTLATCNVYDGHKGILRSIEGTVSQVSSSTGVTYLPGRLRQEIKINYCTTLDLIYAGVLARPPLWEFHRLKHGISKNHSIEALSVPPPKRIKVGAVYDGMSMIVPPREVELFDLTGNIEASQSTGIIKGRYSVEDSPDSIPALISSP